MDTNTVDDTDIEYYSLLSDPSDSTEVLSNIRSNLITIEGS